jgi:hypothetical protein
MKETTSGIRMHWMVVLRAGRLWQGCHMLLMSNILIKVRSRRQVTFNEAMRGSWEQVFPVYVDLHPRRIEM